MHSLIIMVEVLILMSFILVTFFTAPLHLHFLSKNEFKSDDNVLYLKNNKS